QSAHYAPALFASDATAGHLPQTGWRRCNKCQDMIFTGNRLGICAAGGTHDPHETITYTLPYAASTMPPPPPPPGTTDTRTEFTATLGGNWAGYIDPGTAQLTCEAFNSAHPYPSTPVVHVLHYSAAVNGYTTTFGVGDGPPGTWRFGFRVQGTGADG